MIQYSEASLGLGAIQSRLSTIISFSGNPILVNIVQGYSRVYRSLALGQHNSSPYTSPFNRRQRRQAETNTDMPIHHCACKKLTRIRRVENERSIMDKKKCVNQPIVGADERHTHPVLLELGRTSLHLACCVIVNPSTWAVEPGPSTSCGAASAEAHNDNGSLATSIRIRHNILQSGVR
jgi:hypothetical protein